MGKERFRTVADLQEHAHVGFEEETGDEVELEPGETEGDEDEDDDQESELNRRHAEEVAEEAERLVTVASRLQCRKGMHVECGNAIGRFVGGHAPTPAEQGCMFFVICCCEGCKDKRLTYSEYGGRMMTVEQFHEHGTDMVQTEGAQGWRHAIKVVRYSKGNKGKKTMYSLSFDDWQRERSKAMFELAEAHRRNMWIYWPGENHWFLSQLTEYDEATGLCKVIYDEDGAVEYVTPAGELMSDRAKDSSLGQNLEGICCLPANALKQTTPVVGAKRHLSQPKRTSSRPVSSRLDARVSSRSHQIPDSPMLAAAALLHIRGQDGEGASPNGVSPQAQSGRSGRARGRQRHQDATGCGQGTHRIFPQSSLLADLEPGMSEGSERSDDIRLLSVSTALRMRERMDELTAAARIKRLLTPAEAMRFMLWWMGLESGHRLLLFRTIEQAAERDTELLCMAQLVRTTLTNTHRQQ